MIIFLKDILRSLKTNWLSIFSLVFFISIIVTVFSAASSLTNNLNSSFNRLNSHSHLHDALINEDYDLGNAEFTSKNDYGISKEWKSQLNSTASRYYYKNGDKWVLSTEASPIATSSVTPPSCYELGAQLPSNKSIFNFTNPWSIQFNASGMLTSPTIDATFQCGSSPGSGTILTLSASSSDKQEKEGYQYVKNIFDNASTENSETEIHNTSSGLGKVLSVKTTSSSSASSSSSDSTPDAGKIIVKNQITFLSNTLAPLVESHQNLWTKAYKQFYNRYSNLNNLPSSDPLANSRFNQTQAHNLLKDVRAQISASDLNYNSLKSYYTDGNDSDNKDVTDPNANFYALTKLFFYVWLKDSSIKTLNQWYAKISENNFAILKKYIKDNEAKKYFASNLNDTDKTKFTTKLKAIINNQNSISALFNDFKKIIESQLSSNNNDQSSARVNLISQFITAHNLWDVRNLLNNFEFLNPNTNQKETYKITNSSLKSIIVVNPSDSAASKTTSQNIDDDASGNHSFKIIQANQQLSDNFVNKLYIEKGNNLYYNSYSNYAILQRWLDLRNNSKALTNQQTIPFVQLILRMSFTSNKIKEVFQKYYNQLQNLPHSYLSSTEQEEIRAYLQQIQDGQWSYDGYRLDFNFTSVDFFNPLVSIAAPLQKITQIPAPTFINNYAADFGVISPSYAIDNNKEPISQEDYEYFQNLLNDINLPQSDWEAAFAKFVADPRHHKNLLDVGGTPVIIVGQGLSSDFAFPSLSLFNIIPNPKREALVYVNANGYNHFSSAYPAGTREQYISVAYPPSLKEQNLTTPFFEQLSQAVNEYSNKKILYKNDDTSMTFSASAYRVSFIQKILAVLSLVSYLIIGLVSLLALFGVVVLIRRYSKNNSAIFGNLGANGVSKKSIIFSSILFVLIPSILGPIIGYFTGLSFQNGLFSIISNYWFLQSETTDFNFLTLLIYILIPVVILAIVAVVSSAIALKASSLALMRDNPIFKQTKFSLRVNGLFNKFSPLWKFRFVVAVNSMNRIFLLSGMSSLMLIVLVFVFSNMGQFNTVAQSEFAGKRYGYAIQYATPTQESGQPQLRSYQQLGQTYLNNTDQKQFAAYYDTNLQLKGENIDFNAQNPLLVGANITNFYQDAGTKFGANYKKEISEKGFSQAFKNLNAKVHVNPSLTNGWAQASILTQFFLRSNHDDSKSQFVSRPLPDVTENSQKLFYGSSEQAVALNAATNPFNATSEQEKQTPLFNPDLSKENSDNFYYSEYVPVINEDRKPTKTARSGDATTTSTANRLVLAPDGTPLFQPLADYYLKTAPLLNNNNGTDQPLSWTTSSTAEFNSGLQTKDNDFRSFSYSTNDASKTIKLPLLERLYKDNANYWVFSLDDKDNQKYNLSFLQNKVLIKLLLDNTISINAFGLQQKINTWNIVQAILGRASPDSVNLINSNNKQLIRHILRSRYAPFFVNRFMSLQHVDSNNPVTSFEDGDIYNGHESYLIKQSDLTAVNNNSADNSTTLKPGFYYLDSTKTVYTYLNPFEDTSKANANQYKVFSFFRPDFLYFVFAMLNDPAFQNPGAGPVKLAFGDSAVMPNYDDPGLTWTISGDPSKDANYGYGLVATDPEGDNTADYTRIPNGDQTYTSVDGHFANGEKVQLMGLKLDRRGAYNLLLNNDKVLNSRLYQPPEKTADNEKLYPIVVNQYTAKYLNAGVGSVLDFNATNTFDRFAKQLLGEAFDRQVKLKIVGISDTYFNNAFYISQYNANEILGLNPDYGYNGIFTKKPNDGSQPLQFSSALSIYSPSGIYGASPFDDNNASSNELLGYAGNQSQGMIIPPNLDFIKLKFGLENKDYATTVADVLKLFRSVYGTIPVTPLINNLNDSTAINGLFGKLSGSMEAVITIILVVFIPLLVIMVMMVTSLVIDDLKQLSIIMVMLGFNSWENSMTVFTYLIPVLILSLVIGMPLSVIFVHAYVGVIFSSISILLPINLEFWYFASGIGILLTIFTIALLQSFTKLKRIFLPIAMKAMGD